MRVPPPTSTKETRAGELAAEVASTAGTGLGFTLQGEGTTAGKYPQPREKTPAQDLGFKV